MDKTLFNKCRELDEKYKGVPVTGTLASLEPEDQIARAAMSAEFKGAITGIKHYRYYMAAINAAEENYFPGVLSGYYGWRRGSKVPDHEQWEATCEYFGIKWEGCESIRKRMAKKENEFRHNRYDLYPEDVKDIRDMHERQWVKDIRHRSHRRLEGLGCLHYTKLTCMNDKRVTDWIDKAMEGRPINTVSLCKSRFSVAMGRQAMERHMVGHVGIPAKHVNRFTGKVTDEGFDTIIPIYHRTAHKVAHRKGQDVLNEAGIKVGRDEDSSANHDRLFDPTMMAGIKGNTQYQQARRMFRQSDAWHRYEADVNLGTGKRTRYLPAIWIPSHGIILDGKVDKDMYGDIVTGTKAIMFIMKHIYLVESLGEPLVTHQHGNLFVGKEKFDPDEIDLSKFEIIGAVNRGWTIRS